MTLPLAWTWLHVGPISPPNRADRQSGFGLLRLDGHIFRVITMVQTRGSNVERDEAYGRFSCKAKGFKPHESIAATLKGVTETIVESFLPESLPDKDEVGIEVRSLLPAPSELFSVEYFKGFLFPVKLLKEMCEYYGFLAVLASVLAPLLESCMFTSL